jgi:Uma2 family endonuclease
MSLEGGDSLSVGFKFAPSFWGHGYALEAITAVVDDCFERLDEPLVVALVRWDNERSVRVLRRSGFRPRGRRLLEANHLCELYEISQHEWKESRVLGPDPIRTRDSTPSPTPEQYLELEGAAVMKNEQLKGLTRAATGESADHSSIVVNIVSELKNRLRGCRVFNRDLQIHVPAAGFYTHPDVSVVCGDVKLLDEQRDVLLNPVLIVEVLSASTRNYDRGHKFGEYRKIPGLREYLMVEETRLLIEQWVARDGGWVLTEYKDLTETVELVSVPTNLPVAAIYDGIKF